MAFIPIASAHTNHPGKWERLFNIKLEFASTNTDCFLFITIGANKNINTLGLCKYQERKSVAQLVQNNNERAGNTKHGNEAE